MVLKCVPDFAQQIMEQVMCRLKNVEMFLDDIGIFSNTWEDYLILLEKVLPHLEANSFTVNLLKCACAIHETDWLGYFSTLNSLKQ